MAVAALLIYGVFGGKEGHPGNLIHAQDENEHNVPIVYYSYSGTTKRVAEQLQGLTGGDLYDIQPARMYSSSSTLTTARLMWERFINRMPQLAGELPNLDDYDLILVGSPVWNNNIANPVMSYLEQTDFKGKTVAPFWTYAGSTGSTSDTFADYLVSADKKEGLGLSGAGAYSKERLKERLTEWLKSFLYRRKHKFAKHLSILTIWRW